MVPKLKCCFRKCSVFVRRCFSRWRCCSEVFAFQHDRQLNVKVCSRRKCQSEPVIMNCETGFRYLEDVSGVFYFERLKLPENFCYMSYELDFINFSVCVVPGSPLGVPALCRRSVHLPISGRHRREASQAHQQQLSTGGAV